MLDVVDSADLAAFTARFERTLSGGPALLPLPADPAEAARTLAAMRPEVAEEPGTVIVATSGSTGKPKGVRLPAAAIRASAAATIDRLGGPGTWHLALPAHYVAGAMIVARAVLSGSEPVQTPADLTGLAPRPGRNYLSLVPTQAVRALADPGLLARLAAFDAVLLGGAPIDPAALTQLHEHGVRIVTTYGMSETCGGCVYDGRPLPGVAVRVDEDGRIRIGGPTIFAGYRLDPDSTRAALRDGELVTNDRGELRDGLLRVLGRIDDVIISGGVNVDLAEVQRALDAAGIPGVAVGVPDNEWGQLVAVATTGPRDLGELRAGLSDLPAPALPRALARVPRIPLLPSGKPDRRALAERWHDLETERR